MNIYNTIPDFNSFHLTTDETLPPEIEPFFNTHEVNSSISKVDLRTSEVLPTEINGDFMVDIASPKRKHSFVSTPSILRKKTKKIFQVDENFKELIILLNKCHDLSQSIKQNQSFSFSSSLIFHIPSFKMKFKLDPIKDENFIYERNFNKIVNEFNKINLEPVVYFNRFVQSRKTDEQATKLMRKNLKINIDPLNHLTSLQKNVLLTLLKDRSIICFPTQNEYKLSSVNKINLLTNFYFEVTLPFLSLEILQALDEIEAFNQPKKMISPFVNSVKPRASRYFNYNYLLAESSIKCALKVNNLTDSTDYEEKVDVSFNITNLSRRPIYATLYTVWQNSFYNSSFLLEKIGSNQTTTFDYQSKRKIEITKQLENEQESEDIDHLSSKDEIKNAIEIKVASLMWFFSCSPNGHERKKQWIKYQLEKAKKYDLSTSHVVEKWFTV